jgi:hypothetical protein
MKGQAMIEFLMTYGWAILALVIVLGLILSTGIASPNYLVAEECNFGTNIPCTFALFNEGGTTKLSLGLFNGFPYKIRIKTITIRTEDGSESFSGLDSNVDLDSGSSHTFNGDLSGPPVPEGSVNRFVANITYVSCAPELDATGCSTIDHAITGRIRAKPITQ